MSWLDIEGWSRKSIRKPAIVVLCGALLVCLAIAGLRKGGQLEFLELAAYDRFIRMVPKLSTQNPRIMLIAITEQDIQAIGRWPLTDETVANALKILLKENPRAVGLDIYRDIPVPPGSEELNSLFADHPNIVGVMTIGDRGIPPLTAIRGTEQAAFGDIIIDPGGIVRRGLLFLDDGQNVFNSFALRLATLYLEAEGIASQPSPTNPQYVCLQNTTIKPFEENDGGYTGADARGYQFLLDFRDAGDSFRSFSFSDLLADRIPNEAITGKIVLVGVDAQSVKDDFFSPLSRGFDDQQQIPGVVLHGHITCQLLRFALDGATPIKSPAELIKVVWLFFWGLIGSLLGFRTRSVWRFSILTLGGLSIISGIAYAAFLCNWWIPLIPPSLSFFISAAGVTAFITGREKRERAMLMQIFSKHVSPEVAGMIWEQREQFLDNGRPRSQDMTITVFFSDLRGYTTTSEKMTPQELIDWLNTYMESMAGLIMKHGGVVNSYAGDGIKADFGVPFPRQNDDEIRNDARNAVACALAMEKEMSRLNDIWGKKGMPAVGMRVGIYTGRVVGGLLGSSQRMEYSTIGDTVNIASRLESYDKEVGKDSQCRILIGDSTLQYLNERFITEKIGEVSLKGKEQKIIVHRVLSENSPYPHANSKEVS